MNGVKMTCHSDFLQVFCRFVCDRAVVTRDHGMLGTISAHILDIAFQKAAPILIYLILNQDDSLVHPPDI